MKDVRNKWIEITESAREVAARKASQRTLTEEMHASGAIGLTGPELDEEKRRARALRLRT